MTAPEEQSAEPLSAENAATIHRVFPDWSTTTTAGHWTVLVSDFNRLLNAARAEGPVPAPSTQEQRNLEQVLKSALCVLACFPRDNLNPNFCKDIDHALAGVRAALASPPAPSEGILRDTQAGLDGLGRLREAEHHISRIRVFSMYESCKRTTFYVELTTDEGMTITPAAYATGSVYTDFNGLSLEEARDRALIDADSWGDLLGLAVDPYIIDGRTISPSPPLLRIYSTRRALAARKAAATTEASPPAQPGTGAGDTLRISSNPSAPLVAGVEELIRELRTSHGPTEKTSDSGGVIRDAWLHCAMQRAADAIERLSALKAHPTIDGGDEHG